MKDWVDHHMKSTNIITVYDGRVWLRIPISQCEKLNLVSSSMVLEAIALYSASILDLETVGCFLAVEEIQLVPKKMQKPFVERMSSGIPLNTPDFSLHVGLIESPYLQDWVRESQDGFKQSDLSRQCTHRYKIYIEGSAWSVSQKYILACDSVTLLVKPHYYDFFSRGLQPVHHYWPIREDDKCRSIKFAVDWGNSHKQKAQAIGKTASKFIQEELKMDYVYDYMFHLLNEYGKLFKYKPTIPEQASELCPETMACPAQGLEKELMMDSRVNATKVTSPCTMPRPFTPASHQAFLKRKANSIRQVELWEKQYWDNMNMEQ